MTIVDFFAGIGMGTVAAMAIALAVELGGWYGDRAQMRRLAVRVERWKSYSK